MAEDAKPRGKSIPAAPAALGAGAVVGFLLDPAKGLEALKWLNASIGAAAFIAVVSLGAGLAVSVTGNWLMWKRLKEKDQECQREMSRQRVECQTELTRQRETWKAVVDSKEADNKEIAKTLAGFLEQVTLLAERARVANIPTRSH